MHIIGAGGHAKVIADIILANQGQISGVWDENPMVGFFLDHPILGNLKNYIDLEDDQFIIAVGNNRIRQQIANQLLQSKVKAIHPSSYVASKVKIGNGSVCMANSSINIDSVIGEHVIINTNASVDHDCKIANFVHISPQVGLAGNVEVGEGTHVGIGACIIQGVKIGKWATIGAGAVVLKDVPDYAVVVGNPGRVIKFNTID
ncbi:acetyltransferase [Pedobacter sp. UC225_65]|uniref:acetyltransferase n=1 Tax=Pedobacter sp. UC225_65 TaxID=3350173 RepID=UPI00366CEC94